MKNIKQYVVTTTTTLYYKFKSLSCTHEWEEDNWITNETCPPELAMWGLYDNPTNCHPIDFGMSKIYYFKCKKCHKKEVATHSSKKYYDIYNNIYKSYM